MRVFIAIELEDEIKTELKYTQEKIKTHALKGRFTDKDNFHLTLRFIGDVQKEKVDSLKRVIDYVAMQSNSFNLTLDSIGTFPKKHRHIVWIGLQGELRFLNELYEKLEAALENEGVPKEERQYNPHITLGRQVKLNQSIESLKEEIKTNSSNINVKTISLMESTQIEGKLVYRPLYQKGLES